MASGAGTEVDEFRSALHHLLIDVGSRGEQRALHDALDRLAALAGQERE